MRESGYAQGLKGVASTALLAGLLGGGEFAAAATVPPVTSVELRDQNGRIDSVQAHNGRAFVAFVVGARKLRKLKGWEVALRKACPAAQTFRVADVPRRPPTTHDAVAGKVRGRVPPDVSILIDLEGAWAEALRLNTSEVNAIVFGPDGTPGAPIRGSRNDALVARLRDALAEAGGCKPEPAS